MLDKIHSAIDPLFSVYSAGKGPAFLRFCVVREVQPPPIFGAFAPNYRPRSRNNRDLQLSKAGSPRNLINGHFGTVHIMNDSSCDCIGYEGLNVAQM